MPWKLSALITPCATNSPSSDRTYLEIEGDHFAFREEGERDGGIPAVAEAIVGWLKPRFPAAE